MKRWLKRFGYLLAFLVWLGVMAFPCFACVLMSSGQIAWGDDPQDQLRIFLLQEPGQEGLGVQWTRPDDEIPACLRTSVRYYMLEGEGENNDYCACSADTQPENVPQDCELE